MIHALDLTMERISQETRFTPRPSDEQLRSLSDTLVQARAINPDDPETIYMEGLYAKALGQIDLAENAFLEALGMGPHFPRASQALIELYIDTGRLDSAEALLLPLLDLKGQSTAYHYLAARLLYKRGDLEAAKTRFEALNALTASDPNALAYQASYLPEYADTLQKLGFTQEAIATYQQGMALKQPTAKTLTQYADVLDKTDDAEKALQAYRQAFIKNPKMLNEILDRATQRFFNDGPAEGLHQFAVAYKIAPTRSDVLHTVSDIIFHLWRSGQAIPKREFELAKEFTDLQTNASNKVSDALLLSKIKLETVVRDTFSNDMKTMTQFIASKNTGNLNGARAWLILENPLQAKKTLEAVLNDSTHQGNAQSIIALLSLNAWPYAKTLGESSPFAADVAAWGAQEAQKANVALNEGESALKQSRYDAAADSFYKAIDHHLFNGNSYFGLARVFWLQQAPAQAQNAYKIAKTLGFQAVEDESTIKILKSLDPEYQDPKQRQKAAAKKQKEATKQQKQSQQKGAP